MSTKKKVSADLGSKAMLVDLTIRRWFEHATDQDATREVAEAHGSNVSLGQYRKKLLPREALALGYSCVEREIRKTHKFLTLPWGDDGYRILSSTGFFDYRNKMKELTGKADEELNKFWPKYDDYKAQMKAQLNGLYKEEDYPSIDELKAKFGVEIKFKPLPTAADFRVKLGKADLAQVRASIEQENTRILEQAMKDVYARLHDVVARAAERLKEYNVDGDKVEGKFRDSLIGNIVELLDVVPALNITDDPALRDFADRTRKEVTAHQAEVLRDDETVRKAVIASADDIVAKMGAYL
jgi:hypothetical protein